MPLPQVILLEDDARLKATRLEASEQHLAAERERHGQEATALDQQLRAAHEARAAAQAAALAASRDSEDARRAAEEAAGACVRSEAALNQLQQQHEALRTEAAAIKQRVSGEVWHNGPAIMYRRCHVRFWRLERNP